MSINIKEISSTNQFFILCKESRIENPRSFYGCFYIGPFNSGQSLTVANALRRTLLSELKGLAITKAIIDGAAHEFSNLPGIKDSVLDILLNLKEIVLKSNLSLKKPQIGYVQARGPGVVRAGDLKLPNSIQCVDPSQYIATLCEDGLLNMKFEIHQGINYVLQNTSNSTANVDSRKLSTVLSANADRRRKSTNSAENNIVRKSILQEKELSENSLLRAEDNTIFFNTTFPKQRNKNVLLIDAVFMPVNKVNYVIECHKQFEQQSVNVDFRRQSALADNMVMLEIWTNGSIHPRQAIYDAFKNLIRLFSKLEKVKIFNSVFLNSIFKSNNIYNKMIRTFHYNSHYEFNLNNIKIQKQIHNLKKIKNEKKVINKLNQLESIDIGSLNISLRPYTCLKRANINTIYDLLKCTSEDLLQFKNFGKRSLEEVEKSLQEIGLHLKKVKNVDSPLNSKGPSVLADKVDLEN